MTFYRHFIERSDFEVMVVTSSRHVDDQPLPYEPVRVSLPAWWERACRTRFLPYLYPLQVLAGHHLLGRKVMKQIMEFQPEAVFSVAGSWDWTTLAGQKVARALRIPMVASFNDWYDYGWFPADDRFRPLIEERFRRFYQEADLALCTSEGMREELGKHSNAHVWYPTGAVMQRSSDNYEPTEVSIDDPLIAFFGGSLGGWYGPMMESIVLACEDSSDPVEFRIFGALEAWSPEFGERAKKEGIFRGRVEFDRLRQEALAADLLILPMGFGKECEHAERTSFKTKFLDYLSFQRPILVWGPEYCSAVRVAREFDSAECVTDPSPEACRKAIAQLAADPLRRAELMGNAKRMYDDRFHPDRIHSALVQKIKEVVDRFSAREGIA
ncbi:glycosyltransferase [Haloferula chungangensis]|uniref:Glycosyltransferase n=1 Tax=Haloferula chungangensis TaxID=1048331 RepID=A0ABW2L6X1_9BACT